MDPSYLTGATMGIHPAAKRALWALMLICITAGGCAPVADVESLDTLAEFIVGPARMPGPLTDVSDLLAMRPELRRYRVVAGNDGRESMTVLISAIDSSDNPSWSTEDSAGRIAILTPLDDGSWITARAEDLSHSATTQYDPPIAVLPAALDPNQPTTIRAAVRVVSRDDPAMQMDRGTCEQTIRYEAVQRLRTPAGTFDCHRLRVDYTADLNLAKVHQQSWRFLSPDVGLVAEVSNEQVTALLLGWTTQRTMVLESVQSTVIAAPH